MSTVKIENKPNEMGKRAKTTEEFIKEYTSVLETRKEFSKDVVEFAELMAKRPADVFIIPAFEKGVACEQIRQGDIYLFRKGEKSEGTLDNVQYAKYIKSFQPSHEQSNSMCLQFGTSVTGDHTVIPLAGTNVTITEGTIELPIKNFRSETSQYKVKMIVADGPFGVFHSEHGNVTCQKGTYLACTQLDARSMTMMKD